jgi:hypothetical protein
MKISSDLGNRHPVIVDQLGIPATPLPVEQGHNKAPMTDDHAWFCYKDKISSM